MTSWLTLQEYSNTKGISISTLRRKIKGREIEFTFKNGRYLLKNPIEEDLEPLKELKKHYQKLLKQKEEEIKKLKDNQEDLFCLIDFLENQKTKLLKCLEEKNLSL